MPFKSRTTLKSYFESGDFPTSSQMGDLVDSIPNFVDDSPTYGFNWRGEYDNTERYVKYDSVFYPTTGASYVCIKAHDTEFVPTNTTYWSKISEKGADGKYVTSIAFVGDDMVFTFDDATTTSIVGAKTTLKGDAGYTPVKGVDYFDGADGVTPVKGVDYFDGDDGVIQSIVAGTKIGVDATDPANPIVSLALGADDNLVTDAEKTAIGTIGDKVTKDAASVTGNFMQFDANGDAHDYGWNPDLLAPKDNPTFTTKVTTPAIKITTGAALGKVLTSDANGDATWETASGGSSLWTLMPGTPTRVGNTSFTVTGDVTAYVAKGMIIKWTESGTVRCAMVSIPSTYSAPNTTITIVGDTMASIDASSLKYCMLGAEMFKERFAYAGTIGATGTNIANLYHATEPMRVLAADLQVGTAGTTNSTTIDINIDGTTCFTTKPTLATTVAHSATPFTADTTSAMTLNQQMSIDIDAVQTTAAIDLYVQVYLFPTRYLSLS